MQNYISSVQNVLLVCGRWFPLQLGVVLVGPILDDRLKEKLMKPWKGAHSSHFRMCPSVRKWAIEQIFWPSNLISCDPLDMRKKRIFSFFETFIFTLFICIFRYFSLYNTSKNFVSSYRSQFFTFFFISQGSFNPKIRFLGQNVWSVARGQTRTKVNTEDTLSGFQECFLQPTIRDRSNNALHHLVNFGANLCYTYRWL